MEAMKLAKRLDGRYTGIDSGSKRKQRMEEYNESNCGAKIYESRNPRSQEGMGIG